MAATTAAIIGIGSTLYGTGMSFRQAAKAQEDRKKADKEAARLLDEARKRVDMNVYKGLSIQKEPYELAREAGLQTSATAIQAARESDRGAAAGVGRIQEAQNIEQGRIRTAMGKELTDINQLVAAEEGRLADIGTQLDLAGAQGAQLASRDAALTYKGDIESGVKGVEQTLQGIAKAAPLFMATRGDRAAQKAFDFASETGVTDVQKVAAATPGLEATKTMSPEQFKSFLREDPSRGKLLLESLQTRGGLGVEMDNQSAFSQNTDPFDFLQYPNNYPKDL